MARTKKTVTTISEYPLRGSFLSIGEDPKHGKYIKISVTTPITGYKDTYYFKLNTFLLFLENFLHRQNKNPILMDDTEFATYIGSRSHDILEEATNVIDDYDEEVEEPVGVYNRGIFDDKDERCHVSAHSDLSCHF